VVVARAGARLAPDSGGGTEPPAAEQFTFVTGKFAIARPESVDCQASYTTNPGTSIARSPSGAAQADETKALALVDKAHANCFIANSVAVTVTIEPVVRAAKVAAAARDVVVHGGRWSRPQQ
jgi:hypothetical protein